MQLVNDSGGNLMTATPVRGPIALDHASAEEFSASWIISHNDPIFLGHYPDLAIFPGVCLVEAVHQVARAHAAANDGSLTLISIEHARFRRPVYPGNRITVTGTTVDVNTNNARCTARIQSIRADGDSAEAARVQLLFERHTR